MMQFWTAKEESDEMFVGKKERNIMVELGNGKEEEESVR